MPPATLGTVRGPLSPEVMPKPHWKPESIVVGPTESLNENVPPGGTTTPFSRWAASWMLCFFSGIEPANAVLPRSINSVMPSDCGSSDEAPGPWLQRRIVDRDCRRLTRLRATGQRHEFEQVSPFERPALVSERHAECVGIRAEEPIQLIVRGLQLLIGDGRSHGRGGELDGLAAAIQRGCQLVTRGRDVNRQAILGTRGLDRAIVRQGQARVGRLALDLVRHNRERAVQRGPVG